MRNAPAIAFVFGATDSTSVRTVQFEGIADEPAGEELEQFLEPYLERFPGGRDRSSAGGIAYFRAEPPLIVELSERDLA